MNERLKLVRMNSKLNIRQFADRIESTSASISRYESGERIPSNTVLHAISKEFGISYAWLKTGEGPMEDPAPEMAVVQRFATTYKSLPNRLKMLVEALIEMDPEWYKTLDDALTAIERRHNGENPMENRDAE